MQILFSQLEASCLQLSFLLTVVCWELFCLQFELFYSQFELLCIQLSFFAYSGKVRLTVSKEAQLYAKSLNCKQENLPRQCRPPPTLLSSKCIQSGTLWMLERLPVAISFTWHMTGAAGYHDKCSWRKLAGLGLLTHARVSSVCMHVQSTADQVSNICWQTGSFQRTPEGRVYISDMPKTLKRYKNNLSDILVSSCNVHIWAALLVYSMTYRWRWTKAKALAITRTCDLCQPPFSQRH